MKRHVQAQKLSQSQKVKRIAPGRKLSKWQQQCKDEESRPLRRATRCKHCDEPIEVVGLKPAAIRECKAQHEATCASNPIFAPMKCWFCAKSIDVSEENRQNQTPAWKIKEDHEQWCPSNPLYRPVKCEHCDQTFESSSYERKHGVSSQQKLVQHQQERHVHFSSDFVDDVVYAQTCSKHRLDMATTGELMFFGDAILSSDRK